MVSLKAHAVLDYLTALVLIACPFVFGFADILVARNVFVSGGFLLGLYSLATNYEYAVVRVIPLGVHMSLDVVVGVFLMISPWVLNYQMQLTSGQEYAHYVLGVGVLALVGMTQEKTEADKVEHGLQIGLRHI